MGLAANQARLLTLTSRMNDLEAKSMRFTNQKILMTMEQSDLAAKYNKDIEAVNALKETGKIVNKTLDANYNNLVNNGFDIKVLKPKHIEGKKYQTNWTMPTTIKEFLDLLVKFGKNSDGSKMDIDPGECFEGALLRDYTFSYNGQDTDFYQLMSSCLDHNYDWQNEDQNLWEEYWDETYHFDQQTLEDLFGPMTDQVDNSYDSYDAVLEDLKSGAKDLLTAWNNQEISISYNGSVIAPTSTINVDVKEEIDKETITAMKDEIDAEYDSELKKVQAQEKRIDMQAAQTNTEYQACCTEMESVKSLIKDNTDRSFNIFG